MARNVSSAESVVVLGLGRFGQSLALDLVEAGVEVLAVDASEATIQSLSGKLTHLAVADTTNPDLLRQLSVHEARRVVVGIGSDIEASLLTASAVIEMGVPHIWAKAISDAHAKLLRQIGVHHVVRPEHDTGKRVAHLVRGRMQDYIEFDEDFAMVKTKPPRSILGKSLAAGGVRTKFQVTIMAVKSPGSTFDYATEETVLTEGDIVIASGKIENVERFSAAR